MILKTLETGKEETIFSEPPMMANAHLQFFYGPLALLMNDQSPEMKDVIAPTDSRWRMDSQLFEQGLVEEADLEKVEIEQ